MTKKDEMSFAERDEAIIHMLGSGKNLWFISDKIGVPESVIIDIQRKWKKGEISLPKQKEPVVTNTEHVTDQDERNELILKYRKEGLSFKKVAEMVGVPYHVVNNVVQREKKKKKSVEEPVSKTVKPLREKDIVVTSTLAVKEQKQSIVSVAEDKMADSSETKENYLKSQITDLNQQLNKSREVEKEIRLEFINFKLDYERKLAAEKAETQKAYDDYSAEFENNKRLRKQVEDLLMVDGLNVGLMQQNLMFRERFEKHQNREKL